jgi:hypothetical protein
MAVILFNNKTGEIKTIKYSNRKENKDIINNLLNNGFKIVSELTSKKTLNYSVFFCETHNRYEVLYYSYPRYIGTSYKRNVILKATDILNDCKYIAKEGEDYDFISIENITTIITSASEYRFLNLIKQLKEFKEDAVLYGFINFLTAQYLAFSYARNRMKVNPKFGKREIEIIKNKVKNGVLEEVEKKLNEIKNYYNSKLNFIAYEELYSLTLKIYGLKLVDTNNYFCEVIDLIKKFFEEQEDLIKSFLDVPFYRHKLIRIIYKLTDDPRYLKYAL